MFLKIWKILYSEWFINNQIKGYFTVLLYRSLFREMKVMLFSLFHGIVRVPVWCNYRLSSRSHGCNCINCWRLLSHKWLMSRSTCRITYNLTISLSLFLKTMSANGLLQYWNIKQTTYLCFKFTISKRYKSVFKT